MKAINSIVMRVPRRQNSGDQHKRKNIIILGIELRRQFIYFLALDCNKGIKGKDFK